MTILQFMKKVDKRSENGIIYKSYHSVIIKVCSLFHRDIQSARKEHEDFRKAMKGRVVETQFLQHKMEEYKNTLEKLKVFFYLMLYHSSI